MKIGDYPISFIYTGNKMTYPNPIKDNLSLWYDFKGMNNNDSDKEFIIDYSGNNLNGINYNFAYSEESGYNDGLNFDGVDDYCTFNTSDSYRNTTYEIVFNWGGMIENKPYQVLMQTSSFWVDGVFMSNDRIRTSVRVDGVYQSIEFPMTDYLNKNTVVTRVLDSDNKVLKIYLNGNKIAEKSFTTDVYERTSTRYYLNSPGTKDNFIGKICSVKVYNKPLSDEEISHNYKIEKDRWSKENEPL